MLAAMKCGRNSIGIEVDDEYCRMTLSRLRAEGRDLFREAQIAFSQANDKGDGSVVQEERDNYDAGGKIKTRRDAKHK